MGSWEMISDEVTAALARFFDGGLGPTHDELSRLIERAGLASSDPRRDDPVAGKTKRVRAVLWYAAENDAEAGERLVAALIAALRASGSFRPNEPNYATAPAIGALQSAFDALGYLLTDDGLVQAKLMEGLEGSTLTGALRAYIRRARSAGDDAAQKIGSSKELCEATARHVVVERGGSYPTHGNFLTTLWQAFDALDLAKPPDEVTKAVLTGDAWSNIEQAAFLLACAINRFRNEEGTGHGRPHDCLATEEQSRIAAEGSALVSELLLDALSGAP